jgi:hypothetical protein
MSQNKVSIIQEVTLNSKGYRLGLNYLLKNYPNNTHLMSCYEGISFRNLARCIVFDRSGKALGLNEYLERPRRFILISPVGKITGVMVTASMPEFYREIEYEDYVVIGTKTTSNYIKFLDKLSFKSKAEIVTFSDDQEQIVRSRFHIRTTHYWVVFGYRGKKNSLKSLKVRLMNTGDLKMVRHLSDKFPKESSPFRSLKFQLGGLSCKNYIISSDDGNIVFAGVRSYSAGIYQLIYLRDLPANSEILLSAIKIIGKLINTEGGELIWRLRKSEMLQNKILMKQTCFVEMIREKHLHLE